MYRLFPLTAICGMLLAAPSSALQVKNIDIKDYEMAKKALQSTNSADRAGGLSFIALLGKEAQGSSKEVVGFLFDSSKDVREWAVRAIQKINPDIAKPVLTVAYSKDPEERLNALLQLSKLGTAAGPAIPAMLAFLAQAEGETRVAIVQALTAVGTKDAKLTEILANMALRDPDPKVRAVALSALPKQEVRGPALEVLKGVLMQDPNPDARAAAINVLSSVARGDQQAIQILQVAAANDASPAVRAAAKQALMNAQKK